MLNAYLSATERLLQNPKAPTQLYSPDDLTVYINTARGQLAGESECIRFFASLTLTPGTRNYNFSAINTGVSATNGIQGVINVRQALYVSGTGYKRITSRPWEWFMQYNLNNTAPASGAPVTWAQLGQGAAPGATGSGGGGSLYLDPVPDQAYSLALDCVCYPNALAADADVEAIPYLWTDAVPFFAAYYALLSSQTQARQADAERMFNHYAKFVERGRNAANPSILRHQYSQAGDPVQANKLQLQGTKPGGAA